MKGWLIAILTAFGAILAGMVKADLEDEKVCRWLARKLVYRATQCLPADERDRWREELIRDLLDLQGRLPTLGWALSVYLQAGRWGQERGVPSRWEVLASRVRLEWQRLRSLTTKRARARSKERHPAYNRDTAQQIMTVGFDAEIVTAATIEATATIHPAGIVSGQAIGAPTLFVGHGGRPDGLPHLSDQAFIRWLAEERQAFEDDIDRKVEEYRRRRDRELGS